MYINLNNLNNLNLTKPPNINLVRCFSANSFSGPGHKLLTFSIESQVVLREKLAHPLASCSSTGPLESRAKKRSFKQDPPKISYLSLNRLPRSRILSTLLNSRHRSQWCSRRCDLLGHSYLQVEEPSIWCNGLVIGELEDGWGEPEVRREAIRTFDPPEKKQHSEQRR